VAAMNRASEIGWRIRFGGPALLDGSTTVVVLQVGVEAFRAAPFVVADLLAPPIGNQPQTSFFPRPILLWSCVAGKLKIVLAKKAIANAARSAKVRPGSQRQHGAKPSRQRLPRDKA
jgi:hypothetical protein